MKGTVAGSFGARLVRSDVYDRVKAGSNPLAPNDSARYLIRDRGSDRLHGDGSANPAKRAVAEEDSRDRYAPPTADVTARDTAGQLCSELPIEYDHLRFVIFSGDFTKFPCKCDGEELVEKNYESYAGSGN